MILFHVVYNTVIGAVGLSFIHPAAALIDRLVPVSVQTDDFETHLLSKENLLSSSSALVQVRHENARTAELFRKHWDALTPLIYENPPMGELLAFKERRKLLDRRCRTVSKALNIIIRDDLSEEAVIEWQSLSAVSDALLFSLEVTNDIVDLLRKKKSAARSFSVRRVRRSSNKSITSYLRTWSSSRKYSQRVIRRRSMSCETISFQAKRHPRATPRNWSHATWNALIKAARFPLKQVLCISIFCSSFAGLTAFSLTAPETLP